MFKIKDIEGNCNAHLYLADDYGDNECTIVCQLKQNHDGDHEEKFLRKNKVVKITWVIDEREDRNSIEEGEL